MVLVCVLCGWVLVVGVVCIRNRFIVIFYIFGWIYCSWRWEVCWEKCVVVLCVVGFIFGFFFGSV